MLKALELVGFKSFADKTRFEFPRGITAVVGPNGSGKSNVVDAIKWVLGEQSVKSLRGKEMADVIFNGSGSRRELNAAEATLTFDNSSGLLSIEAAEIHITRRVYRNGEGEYLINRQPSRLRDIRDLFAGTGVATEAYSVIEQGKVDILLQSSPRERRLIFEEAAGISRFKAKKLESQRRLERVEQNLLRLADIVEEVDSRLRSVRLQAAKAKRYKEYTTRLQELRTQIGQSDWRRLTDRLQQLEAELEAVRRQIIETGARAEVLDIRILETEGGITAATDAIRTSEARMAEYRERIAGIETAIEHQRGRSCDLEEEIARHRRQLTALGVRAGDLEQQLRQTTQAAAASESQRQQIGQELGDQERRLTDLTAQLDALRGQSEQRRNAYLDQMRLASRCGNDVSALTAQVEAAISILDRNQQRLAEIDSHRQATDAELAQLRLREQKLLLMLEQRTQELEVTRTRLAEQRREQSRQMDELNDLRQRHRGAIERAAVLEELEKRLEGVDAGVKELLSRARQSPAGPWRAIRGLVADMLQANVEMAPLIDAALGEMAQFLVVDAGPEFFAHLERESYSFQGRVGFLPLHARELTGSRTPEDTLQLDSRPGVRGRADRFVETAEEFAPLARRLLGNTWIVDRLAYAIELSQNTRRNANFVTLAGEVLRSDGTLTAGPRQKTSGLVSRRSELRALRQQLQEFETHIAQAADQVAAAARQIEEQETRLQTRAVEHQRALDAVAEQRERVALTEDRQTGLDQQHKSLTAETAAMQSQHAATSEAQIRAAAELKSAEDQLADMECALGELTKSISQLDNRRAEHERQTLATRVDLAKCEERLENLRAQLRQLQRDQQERQRVIEESREQLAQCQQRVEQSSSDILAAESQVAELYLRKEEFAAETVGWINRREECRGAKSQLAEQVQTLRSAARRLEEQFHQQELAANEVRHERKAMADRLRDDYGIEIGELALPSTAEPPSRAAVDQEIEDLRRKIHHMGSVNLEALEELDQLEARHGSLAAQYQDLSHAKASLEQIINRINADSRRLFSDTLEVVRAHFQTLFGKLFGGGQADIVLEEGVDILDSGIEIVARPPGKEPRSISLLSGGEKTLTCVALLLSIFRSRPSPFCVLDEVDAALDEANIERFAAVLQEFLAWTQFIVVTHSKKTMTCANTLYGVTMQESGVSKRVSVRFDDISDAGEFRWAEPDEEGEPSEDGIQAA